MAAVKPESVTFPPLVQRWWDKVSDCQGCCTTPCALRYLGRKREDGQDVYVFSCGAFDNHCMIYDEDGDPEVVTEVCSWDHIEVSENGEVDEM